MPHSAVNFVFGDDDTTEAFELFKFATLKWNNRQTSVYGLNEYMYDVWMIFCFFFNFFPIACI